MQNIQKKHGLLEADVVSRQDRIDGIVKASENFVQAGHFDADTIKAKQEQVVHRYKTLTVSDPDVRGNEFVSTEFCSV